MNYYLILGLVCTMAGLLLGIYDYINKRVGKSDLEWIKEGRIGDLGIVDSDGVISEIKDSKPVPFLNHRGLMCVRKYRTGAFGDLMFDTGETIILEEHEITIKRRALDKLHDQGMLGQPRPVIYETAMMRVR